VVCADVDASKITNLKANKLPIYEPGLEPIVVRNQREGRLTFTTDVGNAVERSEVVFIAVGRRRTKTDRPICSTCSPSPRRSAST